LGGEEDQAEFTNVEETEGAVIANYKHPKLVYADSGREMELDVFIPALNLAFEYQGEQHYFPHYLYGPPEEQQRRDKEKREACEREGIKLISVPFWWDGSKESLASTINKYAPDIAKQFFNEEMLKTDSIPEDLPAKYHKRLAKQKENRKTLHQKVKQ